MPGGVTGPLPGGVLSCPRPQRRHRNRLHGHVVPDLSYWTTSSALVVIAILGGGSGVLGPFAGALVYELVTLTGARYMAGSWNVLLGLIILAVIQFAPGGLWGLAHGAWGRGA
jgi:branched-chain amino acid transport system permease protein